MYQSVSIWFFNVFFQISNIVFFFSVGDYSHLGLVEDSDTSEGEEEEEEDDVNIENLDVPRSPLPKRHRPSYVIYSSSSEDEVDEELPRLREFSITVPRCDHLLLPGTRVAGMYYLRNFGLVI